MRNQGKLRAKVQRKRARRKERKQDEEFGIMVKRKGNLTISLN